MGEVLTGAIALVRVKGQVVGLMRDISANETFRRVPVRGLGTILKKEEHVVEWDGTLSCSFMEVDFTKSGLPGAINRNFANVGSQAVSGGTSFEDQVVLDTDGIQVDVFKKETDVIDPVTNVIKPKLTPYATVRNCLIESDSFNISEGAIAVHNQSFKYLTPVTGV